MRQNRTRSRQKQSKEAREHQPQRHQHQQRTAVTHQRCQQPNGVFRREGSSGVSGIHLHMSSNTGDSTWAASPITRPLSVIRWSRGEKIMPRLSSLSLAAPFLALSLLTSTAAHATHIVDPLQIKTDKGTVEGALTNKDQVRAFKGIPFAAPPVAKLRSQPPQRAPKWNGIRPAKNSASHPIHT